MEPKIYKDRSIQAAINRIKYDLGPDAMILDTKRIPASKNDPDGRDMFEVTAVPGESLKTASKDINVNTAINRLKSGINIRVDDDLDDEFENITSSLRRKEESIKSVQLEQQNLFSSNSSDDDFKTIKEDLFDIKDMLFLLNSEEGVPNLLIEHPECFKLYVKLVKSGISKKRAQRFINNAYHALSRMHANRSIKDEDVTKSILGEILSSINVLNPFDPENYNSQYGKRCIAAFIGPTGVGKTTTIAKLAADLSLKQKKSVGLISIDSYRIGALEQLKTYAAIIGLPCVPAFTSSDLKVAVNKLKDREVILIDTAGHSHLDQEKMQELASVIDGDISVSTHLVLSATVSGMNMKEAADNFAFLNPETYVFTKVDETKIRGGIIEQIHERKMPISFITNGQRVPEDIVVATKKNVLKMVLE